MTSRSLAMTAMTENSEVTLSLADAISLVLTGVFVEDDVAGTLMSQMKDRILVRLEYCF